MPSSQNSKGTSGQKSSGSKSSNQAEKSQSKYSMVKEGWGSRTNFQLSHGLKMDPDGLEEGDRILEAFMQQDAAEKKR